MAQACIFLATGYEEVEMLTVVDMQIGRASCRERV